VSADLLLSVLDQSPVAEGSTAVDALANTLDLAALSESLGYHRYWVAEHHGGPMLAGASPEVLVAEIARTTSRLRVGSGGVMLPHYSPFKVAETFSILAALHPGRIDLGIGRAAGTDALTTYALQRDRRQAAPDDFPQQLAELLAYLDGTLPADHPFARLQALPGGEARPVPWLLGSSMQSAIWAADLGLPYAFADFISSGNPDLTRLYRQRAAEGSRPSQTAVAVWALAADTTEEAQRLASSSRMTLRELRRGRLIPVPTPEVALEYLAREQVEGQARRAVIGTAAEVRDGLIEIAGEYGASEVIVVTITHDHGARRRSYELIAESML
jgi:luciferase family oxidoreductase group 1